jgi:sterol desaturase/sphingolipid hydroxylase (fatty acid hydroxylase superfamily)
VTQTALPSAAAPAGLLNRVLYPAVMIGALALLWALLRAGVPLAAAPYGAVAAAGLAVFWGERLIPYRPEWSPSGAELLDDSLFLLVVQLLLPLGLGWIVVWGLQDRLQAWGLTLEVWPSGWPLWAQVLLKIAVGDFLRYWLHRWSHQHGALWRLHAVHHHPSKLYAINVFRFHPADKAIQFLADTLPFILLGVGPEVLAFYFVIYATGGFFQHSNADVRLGWLNYVLVGPELHRWHHSRLIKESNANYAHTFALWDVLFGTYRRPRDRHVGELGLLDPDYPSRFVQQLYAPIRRSGSAPDHGG